MSLQHDPSISSEIQSSQQPEHSESKLQANSERTFISSQCGSSSRLSGEDRRRIKFAEALYRGGSLFAPRSESSAPRSGVHEPSPSRSAGYELSEVEKDRRNKHSGLLNLAARVIHSSDEPGSGSE